MNRSQLLQSLRIAVLVAAAAGGTAAATAASVTRAFTVTIDSVGSALFGQSFNGHIAYDDALPSGTGFGGETLYTLTDFDFDFPGGPFTEADLAYGDAVVDPASGQLLGLEAGHASSIFSFVPAIAGFPASFGYDDGVDAGTGTMDLRSVPTPATAALVLVALAAWPRRGAARLTARR